MSKTEFLLKDNLGPHYVYHESWHQCRCCQTRLFAPLLGLPLISGLTAVVALMGSWGLLCFTTEPELSVRMLDLILPLLPTLWQSLHRTPQYSYCTVLNYDSNSHQMRSQYVCEIVGCIYINLPFSALCHPWFQLQSENSKGKIP